MLQNPSLLSLSQADKTILSLLEFNPRITNKELAKACHLSKDTISYRIKRLEEHNIIRGYTSFVDYKKLGNRSYKLYIKTRAGTQQKQTLKEYLRAQNNVFSIFESNGQWNLGIALFAKTDTEYQIIENSLLERFGEHITNTRFCTMIDAVMLEQPFFTPKTLQEHPFWGEVEHHILDPSDKTILQLMNKNSRTSIVHLAQSIHLSVDATKKRLIKLNKQGILAVNKTIINYSHLGFDHYKLLIHPQQYSQQAEQAIIRTLKNTPSCINIIRTLGPWKLEAELLVQNSDEVDDLTERLSEEYPTAIQDIEISIIRNEELFPGKELLLE